MKRRVVSVGVETLSLGCRAEHEHRFVPSAKGAAPLRLAVAALLIGC